MTTYLQGKQTGLGTIAGDPTTLNFKYTKRDTSVGPIHFDVAFDERALEYLQQLLHLKDRDEVYGYITKVGITVAIG